MCVCVCVCVCVVVVAVVQTAMYLIGYSDCLSGFHELLSPYTIRCHTSLKKSSVIIA